LFVQQKSKKAFIFRRLRRFQQAEKAARHQVVWSWRPGAGAKFVRSKLLRDDGGNKPVTGESAKETVKPSRRESRDVSG
jgi:hypothetical protein